MKLIVGLGNPGAEYAGTRHNAGFAVLAALAAKHGVRVSMNTHQSLLGRGKICATGVYLQQPLTYMNRAGQSVKAAVARLDIDLSDILVISDDLDLPLGSLRIRAQGGAGGQKGLQSISDCLGTSEFARLRLGIGRPPLGMSTEDYVLSRFGEAERALFARTVERAVEVVETFVLLGVEAAANKHNNRSD